MLRLLALVLVFGNCFLPRVIASPRQDYVESPGEGRNLVEELISKRPKENTEIFGTLKIRDAEGRRKEIPIKMSVKLGASVWQDIYQTQPVAGIPAQILIIQHEEAKPNVYFFASKTNEAPAIPKPLDPAAIYTPVGDSDFWACDFGLEFLHWPVHQVIVKKEMRKGRSCRVVESINPQREPGGYARVLSWIDYETGGLIRAEAYDSSNKTIKEFSIKSFKKVGGRWQLKSMEITNSKTDSRTLLEFNLEVEQ